MSQTITVHEILSLGVVHIAIKEQVPKEAARHNSKHQRAANHSTRPAVSGLK